MAKRPMPRPDSSLARPIAGRRSFRLRPAYGFASALRQVQVWQESMAWLN